MTHAPVKPAGPFKYYASVIIEAHRVSRGHWGRLVTWAGYAVAGATFLPAVATSLGALPTWVKPAARAAGFGVIIAWTIATENWRRVGALAARRSLRLRVSGKHSFGMYDKTTNVPLEIVNTGLESTTLESEWTFDVIDESGATTASFPGRLVKMQRDELAPLGPGELRPAVAEFDCSVVDYLANPGLGMIRVRDIYGNPFQAEFPRARKSLVDG